MRATDVPFTPRKGGTIDARFPAFEASALQRLARELIKFLEEPDASAVRLYPRAYEDPKEQEEFERMTRDELSARKLACARAVEATIEGGARDDEMWSATLDEETAHAWLGMLNDARLVLGTRLDVNEEIELDELPADDPDAPANNMYLYLSSLEVHLIDALEAHLPEARTD